MTLLKAIPIIHALSSNTWFMVQGPLNRTTVSINEPLKTLDFKLHLLNLRHSPTGIKITSNTPWQAPTIKLWIQLWIFKLKIQRTWRKKLNTSWNLKNNLTQVRKTASHWRLTRVITQINLFKFCYSDVIETNFNDTQFSRFIWVQYVFFKRTFWCW